MTYNTCMNVFDGMAAAARKEAKVAVTVPLVTKQPHMAAVLFTEDEGSRLYSRLKKETAERVGIKYDLHQFSIKDELNIILETIEKLNNNADITGIIIQKPTKKVWAISLEMEQGSELNQAYNKWWGSLVAAIDPQKDVDGLHPSILPMIQDGTWREQGRVLPATCQAVIDILSSYCGTIINREPEEINPHSSLKCLENKKIIILGKSDLLGKPLYYYLHFLDYSVEMIGSEELEQRKELGVSLTDADVIVTATGRQQLVTADMVREGAAIIDVGEPKPDADFEGLKEKAAFITPVPGGVGPLTVACLMENAVRLIDALRTDSH